MRELDLLLCNYLKDCYPHADAGDKAAFEGLLQLSDPELVRYLLRGEACERKEFEPVVNTLRGLD